MHLTITGKLRVERQLKHASDQRQEKVTLRLESAGGGGLQTDLAGVSVTDMIRLIGKRVNHSQFEWLKLAKD